MLPSVLSAAQAPVLYLTLEVKNPRRWKAAENHVVGKRCPEVSRLLTMYSAAATLPIKQLPKHRYPLPERLLISFQHTTNSTVVTDNMVVQLSFMPTMDAQFRIWNGFKQSFMWFYTWC